MKEKTTDVYYLLSILILYSFFSFVFSGTKIISIPTFPVTIIILFFSLLCLITKCSIFTRVPYISFIWIPYLIITSLDLFKNGYRDHAVCICICICVLLLANSNYFNVNLPLDLFYKCGLFIVFGMIIEMLLPSFYRVIISNLFLDAEKRLSYDGFKGFVPQVGTASIMLIYAEAAFFSRYEETKLGYSKKKFYIILIIFAVFIFLTSKRMISLIAITVPFFVYYAMQKNVQKKMNVILGIMLLVIFGYLALLNISVLSTSRLFGRIAETIQALESGSDISNGRNHLQDLAWNLFKEHKLFGVGSGNFMSASGAIMQTHNAYLQVLSEQGLVGFTLYIIPLVVCLIKTMRFLKIDNSRHIVFSLFVQLHYILYSFTGNPGTDKHGYIIYFIAIAILIGEKRYIGENRYEQE